jgi:hypothetical protein
MSTTAQYASTVRAAVAQVTTANTARDGSGTPVTVLTAGASGSRIDDVSVVAAGTTTAGVVRLFLHDGTNARLLAELLVPAITPSTTVAVWSTSLVGMGLTLPTGWSLRATTHNTETFNVLVTRAGDF